ncbi:5300_t:CDS:2 [Funneliformis caledonium]|uniref:5300_t:CDS:1 n=1 Tax=Funneliformis caledonium TaxID=1117310 RepID=A0A9N8ZKY5_9GLOM|nr:5300_t:CDS:2 [Funneliformis caledonium]
MDKSFVLNKFSILYKFRNYKIVAQKPKLFKRKIIGKNAYTAPYSKKANIPAQEQRKKLLLSAPAIITTPKKKCISSLDNAIHKPKGGDKKIYSERPNFFNVISHISSLENVNYTLKRGYLKIVFVKSDFSKVISRVRSSINIISSLTLDDVLEDDNNSPPSHEEYQTLYNTPHIPIIEVMSPIMKHFKEEKIREDLSHIIKTGFYDSFQEANKHTEFSSQNNFIDNDQYFSKKKTHYQHEIIFNKFNNKEDFQKNPASIRESIIFFIENPLNDSDLYFEVNVQRKLFFII